MKNGDKITPFSMLSSEKKNQVVKDFFYVFLNKNCVLEELKEPFEKIRNQLEEKGLKDTKLTVNSRNNVQFQNGIMNVNVKTVIEQTVFKTEKTKTMCLELERWLRLLYQNQMILFNCQERKISLLFSLQRKSSSFKGGGKERYITGLIQVAEEMEILTKEESEAKKLQFIFDKELKVQLLDYSVIEDLASRKFLFSKQERYFADYLNSVLKIVQTENDIDELMKKVSQVALKRMVVLERKGQIKDIAFFSEEEIQKMETEE